MIRFRIPHSLLPTPGSLVTTRSVVNGAVPITGMHASYTCILGLLTFDRFARKGDLRGDMDEFVVGECSVDEAKRAGLVQSLGS